MLVNKYIFLPFQFKRFDSDTVLLTNMVGEFVFLSNLDFKKLVNYKLDNNKKAYQDLKSKHIITDGETDLPINMLAIKYRTKKSFLNYFTTLHMVVPTLRCNGSCIYCQVSSKRIEENNYDMNKTTAKRIVEMIFCSPAKSIKVEFQGGEPLLNFEIVKFIILYAKKLNVLYQKRVEFVICTNLILVNDEILKFFKKHKIVISTSFDGPEEIHNFNRPLKKDSSYHKFLKQLELTKNYLGMDCISALMTTTRKSIGNFKSIVNEYLAKGFKSIFFRIINPYGFAQQEIFDMDYSVEDFIRSYKEGLGYIINLNLQGTFFMEEYATLLLTRILTPFGIGFVDLQSPAGAGIECAIYNYNGDVYVTDEGRMLGEMGDKTFCIGNVVYDSHKKIFSHNFLKEVISKTYLETLPECNHCVYLPYCGADPVRNYLEQKDIIGNKMVSTHCKKNMMILDYLFKIIKNNNDNVLDVFYSWVNRIPLEKIKLDQSCD